VKTVHLAMQNWTVLLDSLIMPASNDFPFANQYGTYGNATFIETLLGEAIGLSHEIGVR
jgi:hypothetical protein